MEQQTNAAGAPVHAVGSADRLLVRVPIGGDEWFQMPNRGDTRWIASGRPLPFYEACWLPYLTTVRDLMVTGF